MRIVVTGRDGQLAHSLRAVGVSLGVDIVCLGRPELDLAVPASIPAALLASGADAIINAAAYTAVDRAESEPEKAHAVNAVGAGLVAEAAHRLGVPIVHVSTDYVFDGAAQHPYREEERVCPLGAYGTSKHEGEVRVAAAAPRHVVCRTSWVYSPHGQNFVKTMLRLAGERDEVSVVSDQFGCPTYALDLAGTLLQIARHVIEEKAADSPLFGVFHVAGSGEASWADLAEAVFAASASAGGPSARVRRISTKDYPTPARRPADSRLDTARLRERYGIALPDWRASVGDCVSRLQAGRAGVGSSSLVSPLASS
ncbi:dTDP-4-dehydrorhamnose reductase [Labrys sp. KNU-23]|uniref:dTDP-4-dehydrorhamnose reductase n=1 Tax=Labrys sp. KNU-23 TaxID=2789216 RepID=UPI0011EE1ED8|nr:dTDP-4-dehydrorhamnose reductase [Labrys sp. KNU-23]QEN87912.1 dTDP-4-dehydrorhamnose reductase [Labrys sp. KNU-23]